MSCLMCGKPIKWFEPPYGDWLHTTRSVYCTGKASLATPATRNLDDIAADEEWSQDD